MTESEFKALVAEGIDALPKKIRRRMNNVAICLERRPTAAQLRKTGTKREHLLLGIYEGVPQTAYARGYGMELPDKITIFQEPIELIARTPEEIPGIVRDTVWHEVAHHFGLDHDRIRKLERRKRLNTEIDKNSKKG